MFVQHFEGFHIKGCKVVIGRSFTNHSIFRIILMYTNAKLFVFALTVVGLLQKPANPVLTSTNFSYEYGDDGTDCGHCGIQKSNQWNSLNYLVSAVILNMLKVKILILILIEFLVPVAI